MATRYWVGGSGTWDAASTTNWATTSGGSSGASAPNSADTAVFDANSGSGTCTTASGSACATLTFDSSTLGLTLGANHTMSGIFTLTSGTMNLSSFKLECLRFSSSNSNTRSIAFGTGNITLTGSGATIWATATVTNLTITGTPVVNCTYAGATGNRTISTGAIPESQAISVNVTAGTDSVTLGGSGGSLKNFDMTGFSGTLVVGASKVIYGDLTLSATMVSPTTSTGILTFAGTSGTQTITTNAITVANSLVFNGIGGTFAFADALTQDSTKVFSITNGTVKLKAGVTSTVGTFATSGSNQKYLQSTTTGSQATLSQASGTVTVSYLSIKDIAATGGATWNAYVDFNNVDQGGNTGWDFSYSPAIDNEFPVALRSFTQPKRF